MAKDNNKQNRSMFLYTALIFAVALILIIIAFFGQKNIRGLRDRTNITKAEQTSAETQTSAPESDDLAIMANALAETQNENESLKTRLDADEKLLAANAKAAAGNSDEAEQLLGELSADGLTDEQRVLYDQINEKIKNGKEQ